jgi:hypothetical protein
MVAVSQETNYIVFWYPTIFHQEKRHLVTSLDPIDLSDGSKQSLFMAIEEEKIHGKEAYHLHYYLFKEKRQLSDLKKNNDFLEFTFKYVKHSRNGFVVYSFNRQGIINSYWDYFFKGNDNEYQLIKFITEKNGKVPSKKEVEDFVIDRLFLNCYHNAKMFYHEHEVLHESDGRLKAYYRTFRNEEDIHYLTKVPDINSRDNEVIDWFLLQYERQFTEYAYNVSEMYRAAIYHLTKIKNLKEDGNNALRTKDDDKINRAIVRLSWEKYCYEIINDSQQKLIIGQKNYDEFRYFHLSRLSKIKDIDKKKDEIKDLLLNIPVYDNQRINKKISNIQNTCNNALTEYIYCKTLLESKYNNIYRYDSTFSDGEVTLINQYYEKNISVRNKLTEKDRCRKRAFNIRNSIRYIEGIRKKCGNLQNSIDIDLFQNIHNLSLANKKILEASKKTGKLSEFLGFISVSLGISGIGFALKEQKCILMLLIIIGVLVIFTGFVKVYVIPYLKGE